jgi:hypothetical protein
MIYYTFYHFSNKEIIISDVKSIGNNNDSVVIARLKPEIEDWLTEHFGSGFYLELKNLVSTYNVPHRWYFDNYRIDAILSFENKEDAVLFKLTWL